MVNDEILGGLKSALERGESMKRAMMTLFNAGYNKGEIEEAARNLTEPSTNQLQLPIKTIPQTAQVTSPQILQKPTQIFQPVQKISGYGEENPKEKIIIFVLISLLIFLITLLITIFLFRQNLIDFFSSLFG